MPRSRAASSVSKDPLAKPLHKGVTALVRAMRQGKPLGPAARKVAFEMMVEAFSDPNFWRSFATHALGPDMQRVQRLIEQQRRRRVAARAGHTSAHQSDEDAERERIAWLKAEINKGNP